MKKLIVAIIIAFTIYACEKDTAKSSDSCSPTDVSFEDDVLPIFASSCSFAYCHSASGQANGISLDSYANVMGTTTEEKIVGAINHDQGFSNMPKGGAKLDDCLIATIEIWFEEGAKDN